MATLPLQTRISQSSTRTTDQTVIISDYGDGYQQRAVVGINSMFETWDLQWNGLFQTDRDTLNAFWRTRGLLRNFSFSPPGGTAGQYVFTTPLKEESNGWYYNLSVTVKQVFETLDPN